MKWQNETSWQHFLPQVEQRLNSINPQAIKKKQKIYAFEIVNRETLELRLLKSNGQLISNTLAYLDLFSFDVKEDASIRSNFEDAFSRYERNIKIHTESLIHKLTTEQQNIDVNVEVVNLFTSKFLNFIRNPFSIHKVLNTIEILANFVPLIPERKITFERILNGRRPHQKYFCQKLGITDAEYEQWLRMLFMLFIPSVDGELNMLESIVKSLFTRLEHQIVVLVSLYTNPSCLLSDRSFSTNIHHPGVTGFDFNLTSRAFIRYLFAEQPNPPPLVREDYMNAYKQLPRLIQLKYCMDDMELLGGFNRNVLNQSYRHVYCASKTRLFCEDKIGMADLAKAPSAQYSLTEK